MRPDRPTQNISAALRAVLRACLLIHTYRRRATLPCLSVHKKKPARLTTPRVRCFYMPPWYTRHLSHVVRRTGTKNKAGGEEK